MNLWILKPIKHWEPYDTAQGFVVRAKTAHEARILAEEDSGDESRRGDKVWLDSKKTTCRILSNDGPAEMILKDFAAA